MSTIVHEIWDMADVYGIDTYYSVDLRYAIHPGYHKSRVQDRKIVPHMHEAAHCFLSRIDIVKTSSQSPLRAKAFFVPDAKWVRQSLGLGKDGEIGLTNIGESVLDAQSVQLLHHVGRCHISICSNEARDKACHERAGHGGTRFGGCSLKEAFVCSRTFIEFDITYVRPRDSTADDICSRRKYIDTGTVVRRVSSFVLNVARPDSDARCCTCRAHALGVLVIVHGGDL